MKAVNYQMCTLYIWIRTGVGIFLLTLSQTALVFTCRQYKSFENTMGKEIIACNEQFLVFQQCFLPCWRTFPHFNQILILRYGRIKRKTCFAQGKPCNLLMSPVNNDPSHLLNWHSVCQEIHN